MGGENDPLPENSSMYMSMYGIYCKYWYIYIYIIKVAIIYIFICIFTYWSFWIYSWLSSYVLYVTPNVKHTTILYHSNETPTYPWSWKTPDPQPDEWESFTWIYFAVPGEVCDSVYLQVLQNCMKQMLKISPNQHQTTLIWDNIISLQKAYLELVFLLSWLPVGPALFLSGRILHSNI